MAHGQSFTSGAGPGPLIIGGSHAGFPQTGSWSMVELAKLPLQAAIGVFARYAAGRVNPYTMAIGEALCRQFQLTAPVRRKLEVAISSLKYVGTLGDTLEFGFGIEDVVRSMAKSQQGSICLALCSALKECYHDDMCVEVLLEMARLSEVDGQWMPSSLEWKNLLAACAGTLATTDFPRRAEHLMQLPKQEQRLGAFGGLEQAPTAYRSCSSPKSIAEALFALSKVSRGAMEKVRIAGGPDAGWLGAVAEWLLDLKVTIAHSNDQVFHANLTDYDETQVQIIIYTHQDEHSASELELLDKTYKLDDVSKLFSEEGRAPATAVVSGRVEWKSALRSAFLSDFKRLMEIPNTLGELFGSAARIFKAVAYGDKTFQDKYLLACTSYCDQSYGVGFVDNIVAWFPELRVLKGSMEASVSSDLSTARATYERCIANISNHCGCRACQAASNGFDMDEDKEMTPAPSLEALSGSGGSSEVVDDWDPDIYCQVFLAEAIINLSRALANVHLEHKELLPMRSGFEIAYGRQLNVRRSALSGRQAILDLGQIAFCMDFDRNFSIGMVDADDGVEIRLNTVLELFSGQNAPLSTSGFSAICVNGICAFFGILREASDDKNAVGRIHVLPGRIQYEGKSYTRMKDQISVREAERHFDTVASVLDSGDVFANHTLSVRESANDLQCLVKLRKQPLDSQCISVGPSALASLLAARRGLVHCRRAEGFGAGPGARACRKVKTVPPLDMEQARTQSAHLDVGGKTVDVLRSDVSSAAIAALALATNLDSNCMTFIVEKECLDCCIRAALAVDRPERSHFCFLFLPRR